MPKTKNTKNKKKRAGVLLACFFLVAGLYLLITILAPVIPPAPQSQAQVQKWLNTPPKEQGNRLYIPLISLDVPIVEGTTSAALEKGAWHRKPENGDPEKGGNFVLSGHRFVMSYTPGQTRQLSPFYHIDKLVPGDKIYVDFNNKQYTYQVTRKYTVDRMAIEIENRSTEPRLTLYSCDLQGEAAGRDVIEAAPIVTSS